MDRSSSLRTLLRGHKERISDVQFFGKSSDVLASVSNHDCRVWRIFGREDELSSEILLEIRKDHGGSSTAAASASSNSLERVVWHPFNPNQFVLLHKGSSVATFVETTRLMTTACSEGGNHAVCHIKNDSNVEGMLKFIVTDSQSEDAGICDLAWSNQDAKNVLTAHKDGCVRLWDLRSTVYILDGKEVEDPTTVAIASCALSAKCLMTVKIASDPDAGALQCFFLPAFEDASAMFRTGGVTAMEPGSYMTSPFVTYTTTGELALWSPFTMSGSPPTIVRIFQLENGAKASNVSVVTLPPVDAEDENPPSAFVLMSDIEGNIHALHLASQWRDVPGSALAPNRKIAAVTGFDYVIYFKSLQPIYSQSVIASLDETSDVKQWNLDMYCVQSKAVQKLTLSPAMCVAPLPLEAGMLADGVWVEIIQSIVGANVTAEEEDIEFHDYEDLEEVDESFEAEEEDEDDDDDAVEAEPVIADIPPPPMPSFLGGDGTGAFSNWLGNLAGASKKNEPVVSEPAMPTVKSEIDLDSVPLPEAPKVEIRSVSAPPKPATPELLSPMQILGMTVKKEEDISAPKVKAPVDKPKEVKEKKIFKSSNEKKMKPALSNEDNKITILKREDVTPKKPTPIQPADVNTVSGGVTKEDVEDIVRRAVSSHFQKQESLITAEIQKAVRYEMQSGLVPALNKTVAQTLEQAVAKTMKTTVTKTVKDCMMANTAELASSISSQLQAPVVDSFHQNMREVMVPAYENGTRQMFEQISSSIEVGLELKQKDAHETAKLMGDMVKRMDAMGKTIEVLIRAVAQLAVPIDPSASSPPVPEAAPADKAEILRRKIVDLLRANDYEKAFTHALSVSNSAMAFFVCKHSDLSLVLEGDTPGLSQPILLCLMQQLGSDLSTDEHLSVKLAWLQSVALTLDPYDESIKKHIRGVVQQLVVNLQTKMTESEPTLRRHLQMLLQVIRGIGNS